VNKSWVLANRSRTLLAKVAVAALLPVATTVPAAQATALAVQPVPTAACAQMIYSGSSAKGVVRTPHDVVVGPVRFGDLDPRLVAKGSGTALLGIKSPMTVGPTQYPELLVSTKGTRGSVAIAYGQIPSTTSTTLNFRAEPNQVVVHGPTSCGLPAAGFMQYGGGFALAKKQCVTLTVSAVGGAVIARRTVPFGTVRCGSK
jgi:hypothetical protein